MELNAEAVHLLWKDSPPWLGYQDWRTLLFLSWPLPVESLRRKVPDKLELDTFEGQAWVSLVAMGVEDQHIRDLPAIPGFRAYRQLNLRTYIKKDDQRGIYFFSLDCDNEISGWIADNVLNIPYRRADISLTEQDGTFEFSSTRTQSAGNAPPAQFKASYTPVGEAFETPDHPLDVFLLRRFFLGLNDDQGHIYTAGIYHKHWQLQRAEANVEVNTVAESEGIELPLTAPHTAFANRIETMLYPQVKLR